MKKKLLILLLIGFSSIVYANTSNLCEYWMANCDCNDYNIYIQNTTLKTWWIVDFDIKNGELKDSTDVIKPGHEGFVLIDAFELKGPDIIFELTDGERKIAVHGQQNYCFWHSGTITAHSSDTSTVIDMFNKEGSYRHNKPGMSYFMILRNPVKT